MFYARKLLVLAALGAFSLANAKEVAKETAADALARLKVSQFKQEVSQNLEEAGMGLKRVEQTAASEDAAAPAVASQQGQKRAAAAKPQTINEILKSARTLLNENKPDAALALLKGECDRRCDNKELNFAIIRAALSAKNSDEALAASDRILIADPGNITAHLAAARIYAEQKNYQLLQLEIAELDNRQDLSPAQRKSLQQLKKELKSPFYGTLSFGYGYESNGKHTSTKGFDYYTPFGWLKIDGDEAEGGGYFSAQATIGVRNKIGNNAANDLSLTAYNKYFFKSRKKGFSDLSVFSIADFLGYSLSDSSQFWMALNYDYALLRRKPYMQSVGLDLSIDKSFENAARMALGANVSSTSFIQKEDKEDRNLHYEIYSDFSKSFGRFYVFGRANIGAERASHSRDISADYNLFGAQLGAGVKIDSRWQVRASLSAQKASYLRFHPGFDSKRRDKTLRANIRTQFALSARTQLSLSATYSRQKSNQLLYDYDNFASFINLKFAF